MPITPFQKNVLHLLKSHRNPDSYVAGGIAIHRKDDSIRYSNDIDFFQESDVSVAEASKADLATLKSESFDVHITIMQPSFVRATIAKKHDSLRLEWVRDTAFRFFPVMEDEELGYRLHDIDLAVNKIIALANRCEVRDVIDVLEMDEKTIGFAAGCWAACGKDPGFTPDLLLEMISRNSIVRQENLSAENLTRKLDPASIKLKMNAMLAHARKVFTELDPEELGCLYILPNGNVLTALEKKNLKSSLVRHYGTIKGSWPRIV